MQKVLVAGLALAVLMPARAGVAQQDVLQSVMGQLCMGILQNTGTRIFFQPIEDGGSVSVNVWIELPHGPSEQWPEPSPSDFRGRWRVTHAPFGQVAFVASSGETYTMAVGRDQLVGFSRDGEGHYAKLMMKCRPTKVKPPA